MLLPFVSKMWDPSLTVDLKMVCCSERWYLYHKVRIFFLIVFNGKYYLPACIQRTFEIKVGVVCCVELWAGRSPANLIYNSRYSC